MKRDIFRLGSFFLIGANLGLATLVGNTLYREHQADQLTELQSQPIEQIEPLSIETSSKVTIEQLLEQPIEQTSQDLETHYGITISPEELVYMTRMVYHEGLDRRAQITGQLDKALAIPAHNIWDRHNWDSTHKPVFSGPSLEEIMFACKSVDEEDVPTNCQYSAYHWHNEDFQDAKENGIYSLKTGDMNDREIQRAYRVVLETITGEDHNLPKNILFYINPKKAKKTEIKDGNHAFTYKSTSCEEIELPKTSEAIKEAVKTPVCRVEEKHFINKLDSVYSHDIFDTIPTRTEYVWNGSESKITDTLEI